MNNMAPVCPTPLPQMRDEMTPDEAQEHIADMINDHKANTNSQQPRPNARPPKRRNKIAAWYRRWEDRRETKHLLKQVQKKVKALLAEAPKLDEEVKHLTARVEQLIHNARGNPRPTAPLERDELFVRPVGAPLSAHEQEVEAYNKVCKEYTMVNGSAHEIWKHVAGFWNQVREVQAAHAAAVSRDATSQNKRRRVGKAEHEIEAVENAARNLRAAMENVKKDLGKVRQLAKGSSGK